MPGAELKEEMRGGTPISSPASTPLPVQKPSLQITLDEEMQKTLVEVVLDDYEKAKTDRGEREYGTTSKGEKLTFDSWYKTIKDLYNGERIAKDVPWQFCSNRSLRIATAILDLIHSRLFPAVWNEDLTRWRPGRTLDTPKSERITKLMNWWVRVYSPLKPYLDLWTKVTCGIGDSLTESYWDVEEIVTGETENIPITDESGLPLTNQDGTPALQPMQKINRIEKTKSRIITKDNVYFLKGSKDIQRDPVIVKETILFKELEELEKKGTCVNITGDDGLEKYMIVPEPSGEMDDATRLRIKKIKLRNLPVDVVREYLNYDVDGVGVNENIRIYVASEHRTYLGGVRMRDITKSGRRPIDFTKYDNYLERPDDLDGEGILHKVRELAEEVDACFNQITDANTLAVLRPFFYDPSGDVDAPAVKLGPNKGIPVTDPARNVYFPPFEIPTERLINAIRLVMEFVERLTAASEYIMGRESGTVGGSGTATRTNAIVQSAEIRFTLPSERLRLGASNILTQHLDLIQLNIPEGMEEQILGEKGERLFLDGELKDEAISGKFVAYLLPDPSMGSKQTERDLMNQLYSILMMNPLIMTNPQNIYRLTALWLKSQGKEPEEILGPTPLIDDITDPEDENTLMIQGDFERVTPNFAENHLFHIQKHMDLEKSPHLQAMMQAAPELTNQILEYNQNHIVAHMEMMKSIQKAMAQGGESSGGAKPGGENTNSKGSKESKPNSGLENTGGPLGKALNTQREGASGSPQKSFK